MSDGRYQRTQAPYADPFADRPQQPPQAGVPGAQMLPPGAGQHPYDSQSHLSGRDAYDDDEEYIEKQPLTTGQSFTSTYNYGPPLVAPFAVQSGILQLILQRSKHIRRTGIPS